MRPNLKLYAFMLDCPDPLALAEFYAKLTGWVVVYHDEDYACLGAPGTMQGAYPGLSFQREPDYVPPVWPTAHSTQQLMAHLDFATDDVNAAVAHALACGATLADPQFDDQWRVLLDPVGHPFCLCGMKEVMESPAFALR